MKKAILVSSVIITALLAGSVPLWANPGPPHWRLISSGGPARYGHKCATDIDRDVAVLFGGKDQQNQMPEDVWEFDPSENPAWIQNQAAGPEGRVGHGLCYDTSAHITILFGGKNQSGQFLNDTWSWNGTTWIKIDSSGPSPRAFFAFAYDSQRQRTVLFGGRDNDSVFADTWVWNGIQWLLRATSGPVPRFMGEMAYDNRRAGGKSILFGGQSNFDGSVLNDTWAWDGNSWNQIESDSLLAPRAGHSMSSMRDPWAFFGSVALFGGWDPISPDSIFGDSWHLYINQWWPLFVLNQPQPRYLASMVSYNWEYPVLLIGGTDGQYVFNDVWACPLYYHYIIGDINGDDIFNGLDVIFAVNYFKGGPWPPYIYYCPYLQYPAGDVNGSCEFNGMDVTYMVAYFKGGPGLRPCPSCPP